MPERNHCRDPFTGSYYPSPVTGENHVIAWHPERNRYGFYTSFIPLFSIPSSFVLTIGAETLIEVPHSSDPASNQYRVDYDGAEGQGGSGFVELDGSRDGETAVVSYQAVGESVNAELFSPEHIEVSSGRFFGNNIPGHDLLKAVRGVNRMITGGFGKRQCIMHVAPQSSGVEDLASFAEGYGGPMQGGLFNALQVADDGLGGKRIVCLSESFLSIADGVNVYLPGFALARMGAPIDHIVRLYTVTQPPELSNVDRWEQINLLADGTYYLAVEIAPSYGDGVSAGPAGYDYGYGSMQCVIDSAMTNDDDTPPGSPAVGTHWFNRINKISWKWDGSEWVRTPRLQVARLIKSGATYTIQGFGIQARQRIFQPSAAINQWYNFPTLLGTKRYNILRAVFNNITGTTNATYLPNGTGGYVIGHGTDTTLYCSFISRSADGLTVNVKTGAALWNANAVAGRFTGADVEIFIERDY